MKDIYLYEGGKVLKNLLGIGDQTELEKAEADYVSFRLKDITATLSSDEFRFHISSADHTSSATQHLPSSVCTPIHAHADLCEIP